MLKRFFDWLDKRGDDASVDIHKTVIFAWVIGLCTVGDAYKKVKTFLQFFLAFGGMLLGGYCVYVMCNEIAKTAKSGKNGTALLCECLLLLAVQLILRRTGVI